MGVKLSEWKLKITESVGQTMDKISSASDKASGKFTSLQDKINKFSDGVKGAASEVPGLNRALELASNPYIAITASVLALGSGLAYSANKAAEFNNQFLELKNLNLGKSQADIDKLNNSVLNLSLAEGLDPVKTSKAFFDVQSATGKYGAEVESIVQKIGRFSIATKTDFNEAVGGATKAMNAFGFGAKDMDKYLESSAKTVQVGITTFDQLAKVQTEYGGAAAAASQNVDTANKVFAAFTSTAKNVDIAAGMTKGAFEGLTQKATIDGFQSIGVKMFDASGKMRKMDDIIRDLVPKIKKLSDQDFLKLRNSIGGSEGLQGMLNQVRSSGEGLIKMFDTFDNTKFNIEDALKNAKGDFNILKEIVGNQLNTLLTKLGQEILPPFIRALDRVHQILSASKPYFDFTVSVLKNMYERISPLLEVFGKLIGLLAAVKVGMVALNLVLAVNPFVAIATGALAAIAVLDTFYEKNEGFRAGVDGIVNVLTDLLIIGEKVATTFANIFTGNYGAAAISGKSALDSMKNFSFSKSYEEGYNKSMELSWAEKKKQNASKFLDMWDQEETNSSGFPPKPPGGDNTLGDSNIKNGLNAVTDGGKSIKQLTVNIEALIKGDIQISSQTIKEAAEDVRRIVLEELVRAVGGAEVALG